MLVRGLKSASHKVRRTAAPRVGYSCLGGHEQTIRKLQNEQNIGLLDIPGSQTQETMIQLRCCIQQYTGKGDVITGECADLQRFCRSLTAGNVSWRQFSNDTKRRRRSYLGPLRPPLVVSFGDIVISHNQSAPVHRRRTY